MFSGWNGDLLLDSAGALRRYQSYNKEIYTIWDIKRPKNESTEEAESP